MIPHNVRDAAQRVEAELAAGNFPTPEDAIRYAVKYTRMSKLRSELEDAESEGGSFTSDDVRRFALGHIAPRFLLPSAAAFFEFLAASA
ncbi:MAG: hypothetical protein L7F77_14830 [Candidatus Magnetominusculus sp. LBB02]|nr:hypothetical protein [Candidatus Magnetominusculus sp. LBB02]